MAAASPSASDPAEIDPPGPDFPEPIYLDHLATTPLDPRVLEAMLPYLRENFGNPSSRTHVFGLNAAAAVEGARAHVAALIGAAPREIIFTSGATEANNLALKGICTAWADQGAHLITCVTEHHAVLDVFERLESAGQFRVTRLAVDAEGLIDLAALDAALDDDARLLSVMAANNETGVLQPLDEIAHLLHGRNVVWHCDAAQAAGKIPLDLRQTPIDLLSISAHKIHGPKGQGALFVRRRRPPLRLMPQIEGGGQERGLRSGTLNVAGIVGLGEACRLSRREGEADTVRLRSLRDELEDRLQQALGPGVVVNGHREHRLPNALSVSFPGIHGADLLTALRDVALSSGSACASGADSPSHVLTALGRDAASAASSLRFGMGRTTTAAEVERAAVRVIAEVRAAENLLLREA
ncbi:MAG: cysteine desulfurase family protein [Candidatus Latescibacterota bacterium]